MPPRVAYERAYASNRTSWLCVGYFPGQFSTRKLARNRSAFRERLQPEKQEDALTLVLQIVERCSGLWSRVAWCRGFFGLRCGKIGMREENRRPFWNAVCFGGKCPCDSELVFQGQCGIASFAPRVGAVPAENGVVLLVEQVGDVQLRRQVLVDLVAGHCIK